MSESAFDDPLLSTEDALAYSDAPAADVDSAPPAASSDAGAEAAPANPPGTRLYIGNLTWQTSENDLREFFASVSDVEIVDLVVSRDGQGKSRGFGFMTVKSKEMAEKCIKEKHDQELQGRKLSIEFAKPQGAANGAGRKDRKGRGRRGGRRENRDKRDRSPRGDRRRSRSRSRSRERERDRDRRDHRDRDRRRSRSRSRSRSRDRERHRRERDNSPRNDRDRDNHRDRDHRRRDRRSRSRSRSR